MGVRLLGRPILGQTVVAAIIYGFVRTDETGKLSKHIYASIAYRSNPFSQVYCLLINNAAFSRRAALSQIITLSTVEAELVALFSCRCEIVWALKLARVRIPAAQAHRCIRRQH